MTSASHVGALITVLITVTCVAGQPFPICPVSTSPQTVPKGITGSIPVYGTDTTGKIPLISATGQATVTGSKFTLFSAARTTATGLACNVVALDFVDFLTTTGSKFCVNPSAVVPTTVPLNLAINYTNSASVAGAVTGFQAPFSGQGRRLLQIPLGPTVGTQCGIRSPFNSHGLLDGVMRSKKYTNYLYSIQRASDVNPGTFTLLTVAVEAGACSINTINLDLLLVETGLSPAKLCSAAGLGGAVG